jgi:hypothetical protein
LENDGIAKFKHAFNQSMDHLKKASPILVSLQ